MVQTESQLSTLLPRSAEVIGTSAGFQWTGFKQEPHTFKKFFLSPSLRD